MTTDSRVIVSGHDIHKSFRRNTGEVVRALDGVSLQTVRGTLTALVGPDGAGKTTLLRMLAGLVTADAGVVEVLGIDVASDPQQIQERISYMPQKFGLYEDLSVQENLNLYADMHGVSATERQTRYPRLLAMTNLGTFTTRLAGRLSGGMKQKLGLACTLVRPPELLLLDEPTVGVDPVSRRELWEIIWQLVSDDNLTVLLSTSYLDEAEHCTHTVVMHQGKVLANGSPADVSGLANGRTFLLDPPAGSTARGVQARLLDERGVLDTVPDGGRVRVVLDAGTALPHVPDGTELHPASARFEDGFMVLLKQSMPRPDDARVTHREAVTTRPSEGAPMVAVGPSLRTALRRLWPTRSIAPGVPVTRADTRARDENVVEVHDLVRRFGSFAAVDHVSFDVRRGEIFGLLGPNGAGKTTTFRMLCGLLPATSGTLRVAGMDLGSAPASARQRIGYVAQKFSLYGQLSVTENLDFFASAYGLRGRRKRERIGWALHEFDLTPLSSLPGGQLPGGYKQRLAMAAALLHEPEILFLDEPTSGADPLARRDFWRRITALADQGVTVIVTTHFMEEAEYCDRFVIQDAGKVLARGTPAEIRSRARPEPGQAPTMESAFIAIVQEARAHANVQGHQP